VSRRIASGTLIADRGPLDAFNQFQFLENGLLGTTSYRAFTARYAKLLAKDHPLVQDIVQKARARGRRASPQVIARDENGAPKFKNLEQLQELMAPYTYRVLKSECLDLPDKIYQTMPFEMLPAQRRLYEQIAADKRFERDDGEIDIFTALTIIQKLRQVTSGFIMVDGEPLGLENAKPRIDATRELVADIDGKIVIWASFREEIRQLVEQLTKDGKRCVEYHGGVKPADREIAIDSFQNGDADIFISNPKAGGTGLTLVAASASIYHSCDYSLEDRLQSEDRTHRIGTANNVVYYDLCAIDTIDEQIAAALQTKQDIAIKILENL
jgi:SNF2 family DNA or RNA helicase